MRTKEEHTKQCEYVNRPGISSSERSHYSKVYGINRSTVLMELPDFNVVQQLPQDIMHVLLEGVFPLHLEQFLDYIIQSSILTLDQINCRVMAFPYGYFCDKPAPLNGTDLQGKQSGTLHVLLSLLTIFISSCSNVGTC